MVRRKILLILIEQRGKCNASETQWLCIECPLFALELTCGGIEQRYERALAIFIKEYGKKELLKEIL